MIRANKQEYFPMRGSIFQSSRLRKRLIISGSILLLLIVAMAAIWRNPPVSRHQVIDWVSKNTTLLVAKPEKIQAQIEAASAASVLEDSNRQTVISGPLVVHPDNPRYFADGNNQIVYLTGSHTWSNLQDNGGVDPPPAFDYVQYLDFLEAHDHNFFRLWVWEQSRWTLETSDENYWFNPMPPFKRIGPGTALDGKPKYDLTQWEEAYFDRMRERIIAAGDRGMYVAIVLFNGWSVSKEKGMFAENNPWRGHPFNAANNINGINGDLNNDNSGEEVHQLVNPTVTAVQEAYVRKVIDTVNDLDNVLYEISNESDGTATEWQYHMIEVIRAYQNSKPQQHPIGMTVEWPNGNNSELFASSADWISPNDYFDPPPADGSKVIINDTDHLWGIGGDREWVWKSFTRGVNPIFMDGYDGAGYGVGGAGFIFDDPQWVSLRLNMGYTRSYAERMNLVAMIPRGDLCSTGYCLANAVSTGAEYLVYLPQGGTVQVNLSAVSGQLSVEWFNPATGIAQPGNPVMGGETHNFTPPFGGDAVLYLYQLIQDVTPPIISQIVASPLDTMAWITWATDEPATSQVAYGLDPTPTISTTKMTDLSTSHQVQLTDLTPATTYYYRVYSEDSQGNRAVSELLTFTTLSVEDINRAFLPYVGRQSQTANQSVTLCPNH